MADSTVSLRFKLEGDGNSFKELSTNADNFRKALNGVMVEAQGFNTKAINFTAITKGIDQATNSIKQLQSILGDLSSAYATQQQAETQLESVMRARMNATSAEIQSIKDLASAQQELGVIGDEVQLSGAKQMAMYLSQKASLETLLPAMNNLIAQQAGLNATQGDAESAAKALGKAMDGNVTALKRMGVSFSDAQVEIMKHGDESERAATLAKVITENVGDLNAELAKTDAGKQKQLENKLGDIKEKLGSLTNAALPFVTLTANVAISVAAVSKLAIALKALPALLGNVTKGVAALGTTIKAHPIIALATVITTVAGTFALLKNNTDKSTEAAKDNAAELEKWKREIRDVDSAAASYCSAELSRLDALYRAATDEAASKDARRRAAEELQRLYPSYFGNLSTEAIMVGALVDKYNDLKTAIREAARQRAIEATMGDNETEIIKKEAYLKRAEGNEELWHEVQFGRYLEYQEVYRQNNKQDNIYTEEAKKNYEEARDKYFWWKEQASKTRKELGELNAANEELSAALEESLQKHFGNDSNVNSSDPTIFNWENQIKDLQTRLKYVTTDAEGAEIQKQIKELQDKIKKRSGETPTRGANGSASTHVAHYNANAGDLQGYLDNITALNNEKQHASLERAAEINKEIEKWQELVDAVNNAGKVVKTFNANAKTLSEVEDNLSWINDQLKEATVETAPALLEQKKQWEDVRDAILGTAQSVPVYRETAETLEEIAENLAWIESESKNADYATLVDLNAKKKHWQDKQNSLLNAGQEPQFNAEAKSLEEITTNISILQEQLQKASSIEEAAGINKQIAQWERLADAMRNAGIAGKTAFSQIKEGWGSIKNIVGSINNLSEALRGNKSAWDKVVSVIDATITVADAIMGIVGVIKAMTKASEDSVEVKGAEAVATAGVAVAEGAEAVAVGTATSAIVAANKEQTASFAELATAAYLAAHADIPFVGLAIGSGFSAGALALIQGAGEISKFAEGGIAYGPTLGIFGEYAGASSNPEVVAPLNKLRDIIGESGDGQLEVGELHIDGRDLVGVIKKVYRYYSRG